MTAPRPAPSASYAQAATHREEYLYPLIFGRERRGLFTIAPDMFTQTYQQPECDPAWLRCGVFEFAPTPTRASWLYVTSGLSNPWETEQEETDGPSGIGCEFVLELPARTPWALTRLSYVMAYQILVCYGRIPNQAALKNFDLIPLNTSIGTESSHLTHLLLAPPLGFPQRHQLRTGWFEFVQIVGISDGEAKVAQIHGGLTLLAGLRQEGAFPVTLPEREPIA